MTVTTWLIMGALTMPNPYISQSQGYGSTYDPDQEQINQQRQMAQMLRQQSMAPIESQMVSGRVVPTSWTQGLAKIMQAYGARKGEEFAGEEQKKLSELRANERAQALEEFQRTFQGTPERQVPNLAPLASSDPNNPPMQTIPAKPGNPMEAYAGLLRGRDPMLAQAGYQGMMQLPQMEARKQEREEQRGFQREQLQAQLEARKEAALQNFEQQKQLRQMGFDNARALAGIAAANRSEGSPVQIIGPDGKPMYVPPRLAYGQQPFNQATEAKQIAKEQGQTNVNSALTALRDAYDRLEKGGGITSTEKGALSNLGAAASSSALGQMVGKALGTQNQSARNDIAMSRPALLAALMQATGMSAKQMDSNAELKLWLATATDPTLDVESNRRALNAIEQKYLGGGQVQSGQSAQQNQPASGFRIIGVK